MKPLVKICGLTRAEDARLAVSLGADYVGAVRAPSSPRRVSVDDARIVFDAVRDRAKAVLVSKDIPTHQVIEDARACEADVVQLYDASDDDVAAVEAGGFRVFRVYRVVADTDVLPSLTPAPTEARPALIDVGSGGTGTRFDWQLLGPEAPRHTFIAGGVRPENVRELLTYRPFGIDLASGVESSPGIKDAAKLRALFQEVM